MVSDMTAYTGMLIKHKGTPLNSQEIFTTVEIKKIKLLSLFEKRGIDRNKIKKSEDILKIQGKPFEHPSAFVHIISLVRCKMSTVSQKGISRNR